MFASFDLHPKLNAAIEQQGWAEPTDVQTASIPKAMDGQDLLISAETGSGKTAAYLLPALHRILSERKPKAGIRLLVMVPTRELAQQVMKDCETLTAQTSLKTVIIRGGQEFQYQASLLRRNPEIVIATPGRMTEHLNKNSTDLLDVECLVLDECDRMLDMGFRDEVLEIASKIESQHQTLLLSATLKHRGVSTVAKDILTDAEFIQIKPEMLQENITQQRIFADGPAHKTKVVDWLLGHETFQKAIVFTKTRVQAEELTNSLRLHQKRVATLHGEIGQDERNRIMKRFRDGVVDVIVATDLAARGLDVEGVDLVINFDIAQSGDEHVHRVGRTGRAGQSGLAISLVAAHDYNLMSSIERYLGIRFKAREVDSLKAKYKGPVKVKSSGKAAGTKKKKGTPEKIKAAKPKNRRNKDKGKRRAPAAPAQPIEDGGFKPLKKKKTLAPDS